MNTTLKYFCAIGSLMLLLSCGMGAGNKKQAQSYTEAYHTLTIAGYEEDAANRLQYILLEKEKLNDTINGSVSYQTAMKIHKASADMILYIQDMQATLVAESEGIKKQAADTLHVELLKNPMAIAVVKRIMLNEGKGSQLKDKLRAYADLLRSFSRPGTYVGKAQKVLSIEDAPLGDGAVTPWEVKQFEDQSLIGALTTLEGLRYRVRLAENASLRLMTEDDL